MKSAFLCLFLLLPMTTLQAGDQDDWKVLLDMRLRIETVDQDGKDEDAFAPTLRTRLGVRSPLVNGFQFLVDGENITTVGHEDFNNTINGRTQYPVVADPEETEVNRLQVSYKRNNQIFIAGRQRLIVDNARFIGNVGWRQNEQTFDALTWNLTKGKRSFTVVYADQVNRIFGDNHPAGQLDMSTWVGHAKISKLPIGDLSVFAHLVEVEDLPSISHMNLGFYLKGSFEKGLKWVHQASYAKQQDYADGSDAIDADYYQLSIGPKWEHYNLSLNYEVLGGDGDYGFSTALATLHAFNGWADVFLGTPANGLQDLFLKAGYNRGPWKCAAIYHQFDSDKGSISYGKELDLVLTRKISKRFSTGVKYADYQADEYAVDTTKLWLWGNFKL